MNATTLWIADPKLPGSVSLPTAAAAPVEAAVPDDQFAAIMDQTLSSESQAEKADTAPQTATAASVITPKPARQSDDSAVEAGEEDEAEAAEGDEDKAHGTLCALQVVTNEIAIAIINPIPAPPRAVEAPPPSKDGSETVKSAAPPSGETRGNAAKQVVAPQPTAASDPIPLPTSIRASDAPQPSGVTPSVANDRREEITPPPRESKPTVSAAEFAEAVSPPPSQASKAGEETRATALDRSSLALPAETEQAPDVEEGTRAVTRDREVRTLMSSPGATALDEFRAAPLDKSSVALPVEPQQSSKAGEATRAPALDRPVLAPPAEPQPLVAPASPREIEAVAPAQSDKHGRVVAAPPPPVEARAVETSRVTMQPAVPPPAAEPVVPGMTAAPAPLRANAGTVAAIYSERMKIVAKEDKNSRLAEKNLPHGKFSPAVQGEGVGLEQKETTFAPVERARGPAVHDPRSPVVAGIPAAEFRLPVRDAVMEIAPTETARAARVDQLATQIVSQAVAFRRLGADLMEATLRPDHHTEIVLNLSLRNGLVEVAARIERGDSQSLQVHWGDLQHSLSQQGIRLGQLTQSLWQHQHQSQSQSFDGSTAWSNGQRQSERQPFHTPETRDELPLAGSTTELVKGRALRPTAAQRRGWEMWV